MGNCVFQDMKNSQSEATQEAAVTFSDVFAKNSFEKLYVVGRGGFGKVWKVQSKSFKNQVFALKEMAKSRVIAKKSLQAVLLERTIL